MIDAQKVQNALDAFDKVNKAQAALTRANNDLTRALLNMSEEEFKEYAKETHKKTLWWNG